MTILIGIAVVFGSIILGYTMHHGHLAVHMQTSEMIIIVGAAAGASVIANTPVMLKRIGRDLKGVLKPTPYGERAFSELLQMLYEVFQTARREGMIGLEKHIEKPDESELFRKYSFFVGQHHA